MSTLFHGPSAGRVARGHPRLDEQLLRDPRAIAVTSRTVGTPDAAPPGTLLVERVPALGPSDQGWLGDEPEPEPAAGCAQAPDAIGADALWLPAAAFAALSKLNAGD